MTLNLTIDQIDLGYIESPFVDPFWQLRLVGNSATDGDYADEIAANPDQEVTYSIYYSADGSFDAGADTFLASNSISLSAWNTRSTLILFESGIFADADLSILEQGGYIALVVDPGNVFAETDETDNVILGQLTSNPPAEFNFDVAVDQFSVTLNEDQTWQLTLQGTDPNEGSFFANESVGYSLFYSTDAVLDGDDTNIITTGVTLSQWDQVVSYTIEANSNGFTEVDLAAMATGGYLILQLDPYSNYNDPNTANNVIAVEIPINSTPNFSLVSDLPTADLVPGETVQTTVTVSNLTNIDPAEAVAVSYYLSEDQTFDGTDVLIGQTDVASVLGGGAAVTSESFAISAPNSVAAGSYYVMAVFSVPSNMPAQASQDRVVTDVANVTGSADIVYGADMELHNRIYVGDAADAANAANTRIYLQATADGEHLNAPAGTLLGDQAVEVFGSDYAETITLGTGADIISAGAGDDTIFGGAGADQIDGGSGFDTVNYSDQSAGVQVYLNLDLVRQGDGADDLNSIEHVIGSDYADRLVGSNDFENRLDGGAGNDIIKARDMTTAITGGDGDDKIVGLGNSETLDGGNGSDTVFGNRGDDTVTGGEGDDFLYGGRDNDLVQGGIGDDRMRGNIGNDTLEGGAGIDRLYGGGSHDALYGDADRDFLVGENGNDTLDGGTGDDNLTGGAGSDVFIFGDGDYGFDRVLDFEIGVDQVDVTAHGITDFAGITAIAEDIFGGVRITVGEQSIFLDTLTVADLGSSDFIYG